MRYFYHSMVLWPLAALAALALLASAPASANTRALFVGLDLYQFSGTANQFDNLHGAVTDVGHIKAALQAVYGWDLDQPVAGQCKSSSPVSITLTDQCATRDAILGALAQLIQVSAPGDTVIFYYAGHGSQLIDNVHLNEPSAQNDTILPYDARGPTEPPPHEILDEEFNVIIENARHVQGVNIVTIFDSCDSATGVRGIGDGVSREAPVMQIAQRRPLPPLGTNPAIAPGWRAHLAAAADGQSAFETTIAGTPAGVFTTALAAAIRAMPGASFADLIEEAQRGTEALGHGEQQPAAEGALSQGFSGGGGAALLVAANSSSQGIMLTAGSLSGMTQGSGFALYACGSAADSGPQTPCWTAARDASNPPLATAHVSAVTADGATLTLDAPRAAPLRGHLVARETSHVFGDLQLKVRVGLPDDGTGARQRVIDAINALPFAKVAEPAEVLVDTYGDGKGPTMVWSTDGSDGMGQLAPMGDPSLPAALKAVLAMRARVDALLALRTSPQTAQIQTCVDNGPVCDCSGQICPVVAAPAAIGATKLMAPPQKLILASKPIHFAVENDAAQDRFVYVFLVETDNSVTLLTPQDAALPAGRLQMITFTVDTPGLKRFLVLATDARHPINATVLEQGQGARDATTCSSALEKLLCQAGSGARDPATQRAGAWSAIVDTVNVTQSSQ